MIMLALVRALRAMFGSEVVVDFVHSSTPSPRTGFKFRQAAFDLEHCIKGLPRHMSMVAGCV
jgi:hypothetical protein